MNDPRGITTDGAAAETLSPPAHAGAARASSARIATRPFRSMTPRTTGTPPVLFRLTSEFCSDGVPHQLRPPGVAEVRRVVAVAGHQLQPRGDFPAARRVEIHHLRAVPPGRTGQRLVELDR